MRHERGAAQRSQTLLPMCEFRRKELKEMVKRDGPAQSVSHSGTSTCRYRRKPQDGRMLGRERLRLGDFKKLAN